MNQAIKRHGIDIPNDAVAEFCRHNHVRKLALFGSVLREDFRADSNVDVLVDLRTPGELSPNFRDEVLQSAVVQYVER